MGSPAGSFDDFNDVKPDGSFLGASLGEEVGTALRSTDGADEGTEMGSPPGSFDGCNEGKSEGSLLGASLG